jgi:hypothetical protein
MRCGACSIDRRLSCRFLAPSFTFTPPCRSPKQSGQCASQPSAICLTDTSAPFFTVRRAFDECLLFVCLFFFVTLQRFENINLCNFLVPIGQLRCVERVRALRNAQFVRQHLVLSRQRRLE